jgi:hypothetical protein
MFHSGQKTLVTPWIPSLEHHLHQIYPNIILLFSFYTLWLFNIAMENDPFIDGLPIKHGDFP